MATYQCGVCGSNFGASLPITNSNVGAGIVGNNGSCPFCGAGVDGFVVSGVQLQQLKLEEKAPTEPLNLPLPEAESEAPAGTKLKDEPPESEPIKSGDEVKVNKIK